MLLSNLLLDYYFHLKVNEYYFKCGTEFIRETERFYECGIKRRYNSLSSVEIIANTSDLLELIKFHSRKETSCKTVVLCLEHTHEIKISIPSYVAF